MTDILEITRMKIDPPVNFQECFTIKEQAIPSSIACHISPQFYRGKLIGIMFDNSSVAIAFKLSVVHPNK